MTELRAGRSLSLVPGLTTLYEVVPGPDRKADVCIGMVATTGLAEMIVGAVNGDLPQMAAAELAFGQRLLDVRTELERRISSAAEAATRAERARICALLRKLRTVDHLAALADQIEGGLGA